MSRFQHTASSETELIKRFEWRGGKNFVVERIRLSSKVMVVRGIKAYGLWRGAGVVGPIKGEVIDRISAGENFDVIGGATQWTGL